MKLAISNIAWTAEEEPLVAKELQKLGVRYVEIAPTKIWEDPLNVTSREIQNYLDFWKSHGIEVVAFQSMLFPKPDLKIFESPENRQETLAHLKEFLVLAGKMDVGVLVFGSPKNRQRGTLSKEEADNLATDFFSDLAVIAEENGTKFCIEPNAEAYACDYITTAREGIEFVSRIDKSSIRLHLDLACMVLAGDDIAKSIHNAAQFLEHFHISAPMLGDVDEKLSHEHQIAAQALKKIDYSNFVSIEMRPGPDGTNIERVRTAIEVAQKYYV